MAAITFCQNALITKIEHVRIDISLKPQDLDSFCSCITAEGQRISDMEDELHVQTVSFHSLQTKVKSPEAKAKEAENRTSKTIFASWTFPEGAEDTDPTAFLERLLKTFSCGKSPLHAGCSARAKSNIRTHDSSSVPTIRLRLSA